MWLDIWYVEKWTQDVHHEIYVFQQILQNCLLTWSFNKVFCLTIKSFFSLLSTLCFRNFCIKAFPSLSSSCVANACACLALIFSLGSLKYLLALSLSFSAVRIVVSRQAPSGPRFLQIMVVSPVKRVGASVSRPYSSALAGRLVMSGDARMVMAAVVAASDWNRWLLLLLSADSEVAIRLWCDDDDADEENASVPLMANADSVKDTRLLCFLFIIMILLRLRG